MSSFCIAQRRFENVKKSSTIVKSLTESSADPKSARLLKNAKLAGWAARAVIFAGAGTNTD